MPNENDYDRDDSISGSVTTTPTTGAEGEVTTGINISGDAASVLRQAAAGPTDVRLQRTATQETPDQALWVAIRNRARAIGFDRYNEFIRNVLCEENNPDDPRLDYASPGISSRLDSLAGRRGGQPGDGQAQRNVRPTIHGMDAYKLLKLATEAFLVFECGLLTEDETLVGFEPIDLLEENRRLGRDVSAADLVGELASYLVDTDASRNVLPYLNRIIMQVVGTDPTRQEERLPYCEAVLRNRLSCPSFIELIWSYWHEEGMLVQTMNSIALRFQNKRHGPNDPLTNLELDPLRPLNNLLWGFLQDESNRLSVQRRAYEYDHHYGIALVGKAVSDFNPADSRAKFIEAFHNLLYRAMMFYREDDDTTIVADAFALLNALREVHIILAEGAHNQFGDLPWQSRKEMLIMQWMLARPEIRDFIRGRFSVPYQELWMGAVDDMKRLQGWGDVTITHFHELGIYGEQILLSVRYGDWIEINDQEHARNWARYWRPEIQRYIHAYNAVSGVDLSLEITDVRLAENRYRQPSVLIADRLRNQQPARLKSAAQGRLGVPARPQSDLLEPPVQTPGQLTKKTR